MLGGDNNNIIKKVLSIEERVLSPQVRSPFSMSIQNSPSLLVVVSLIVVTASSGTATSTDMFRKFCQKFVQI